MKIAIVNISEIFGHPTNRMDADYWVGKKEGKKSFKKAEQGKLVEDDINGRIMANKEDADQFNELKDQQSNLQNKIDQFKF